MKNEEIGVDNPLHAFSCCHFLILGLHNWKKIEEMAEVYSPQVAQSTFTKQKSKEMLTSDFL